MSEQNKNNGNNSSASPRPYQGSRPSAQKPDHRPAMTAILGSLSSGEKPVLDELKDKWGNSIVNQAVRELAKQGLAGVHRRRVHKADGSSYRFASGVVSQKGPGRFLLLLEDGSEAYLTGKSSKTVANGDRVRAFLATEPGEDTEALPASLEARDHGAEHIVRAKIAPSGQVAFYLDNRVEDVEVALMVADAAVGDIWRCAIQDRGLFRSTVPATAIAKIGNEADKGIESKLAFATRFPETAICSDARWPAYSMSDAIDGADRRDISNIPLATIDGESTNDFDDAIAAAKTASGWLVTIAIADVSAFVGEGSDLDKFALEKMTSVYLPHQVHPMLPRSISTGICSLIEGAPRLALCCEVEVLASGEVARADFFRANMKSHARLTYSGAQAFLDGSGRLGSPEVEQSIQLLSEATKAMRDFGAKAGRLDMGDDEISFVLGEDGKIKELRSSARLWTHKMVEECMVAANCAAAAAIEKSFQVGIYRNHVGIKPESLSDVHEACSVLGVALGDGSSNVTQADIAHALDQAKAMGKHAQARSAILGGMSSAGYEVDNKGHFSLVAGAYCQFTSPIRRYPDLMAHRMIKAIIDGKPTPYPREAGEPLAQRASTFSQLSNQAENEARKLLTLDFMGKFVGQALESRISTIGERGVWVALPLKGASLEFFIAGKPMRAAGWAWSEADAAWQNPDKKPLLEGDAMECSVVAVDMGSRRLELAPKSELAPVAAQEVGTPKP